MALPHGQHLSAEVKGSRAEEGQEAAQGQCQDMAAGVGKEGDVLGCTAGRRVAKGYVLQV